MIAIIRILYLLLSFFHWYIVAFECEDGWELFEMGCYRISEDVKNYAEAENDCIQKGGHLTSVHSKEEDTFLRRLTGPPDSPNHVPIVIIGGKAEADQDQVYTFYWTDGSSFDFFDNWAPDQPHLSGAQDCIGMMPGPDSSEGAWFIDICDSTHKYICKKPLEGN